MPLFFLCVRTNVGYLPVAEFICQHETHTHIEEALSIIKSWNDEWDPPFFMTDYSEGEHIAIKTVFPKSEVYLCSFHREQAWERWSKDGKNGLSAQHRNDFLEKLRAVASSSDITEFDEAVKKLTNSQWFLSNTKARNYVQNKWLNIAKRWCPVFWDKGFHTCVRTNNGVEALNRSFKMFYHRLSCDGSVSSTLEEVIHEFIPDMLHSYARTNYTYSSEYRAFSSTIPTFLQNKPRQLITHCMTRISSASEIQKDQVVDLENNIFRVNNYLLELGDDNTYPNCSCLDFQRHFMPCKHFFALFRHSDLSWDDISPLYRNSPYTNLDLDFMSLKVAEEIVQKNLEASEEDLQEHFAEEAHVIVEEEKTNHPKPKQTLGKQLREMLKQIENASFLCRDSSAMKEVLEVLVDIKTKLLQSAETENGILLEPQKENRAIKKNIAPLPVKRQRAKSIVQRYQKRVGKKATTIRNSTNITIDNTGISNDKPVIKLSERCKPTKNHAITPECSELLGQLQRDKTLKKELKRPASENDDANCSSIKAQKLEFEDLPFIMSIPATTCGSRKKSLRVGCNSFTVEDLRTLDGRNWLNDKVMQAYLGLLMLEKNREEPNYMLVLPSFIYTKWQQGCYNEWLFLEIVYSKYQWILVPVCTNNHWVLLVANMKEYTFAVLNSMKRSYVLQREMFTHWLMYMTCRQRKLQGPFIKWKSIEYEEEQQRDGHSCGPFALMYAEALLTKTNVTLIKQHHIPNARKYIRNRLINAAKKNDRSVCDLPFCEGTERLKSSALIECKRCNGLIHTECANTVIVDLKDYACLSCQQADFSTSCKSSCTN